MITTSRVGGLNLPSPVANVILASGLEPQTIVCRVDEDPPKAQQQDLDNDKIPLRASSQVNCKEGDTQFKGGIVLRDKNDNDPKSGYTLDTNQYELTFNTGKSNESGLKLDLDVDVTWSNPNYAVRYNFNFEIYGSDGRFGTTYAYTATYAPDNAQTPFAGGTFNYEHPGFPHGDQTLPAHRQDHQPQVQQYLQGDLRRRKLAAGRHSRQHTTGRLQRL